MHIHIQLDDITIPEAGQVIRALDIFLGVPSMIIDTDLYRRQLYGKAGECRFNFNENRVEYRVLSNFWLFDEKLQDWVWNNTHRAIEWLNEGNEPEQYEGEVTEAINNGDMVVADKLVREFDLMGNYSKVLTN